MRTFLTVSYTHLDVYKRQLNPTPIPIIGDEYVEIEFGTGALKITPAHDKADFEIGRKFTLEIIDILTDVYKRQPHTRTPFPHGKS